MLLAFVKTWRGRAILTLDHSSSNTVPQQSLQFFNPSCKTAFQTYSPQKLCTVDVLKLYVLKFKSTLRKLFHGLDAETYCLFQVSRSLTGTRGKCQPCLAPISGPSTCVCTYVMLRYVVHMSCYNMVWYGNVRYSNLV